MAQLKDKVKFTLDESRILILGGQVLVGFSYESFFQKGFEPLTAASKYLEIGSLCLLLLALTLLMAPVSRHQLVDDGEATAAQHRFSSRTLGWALLPFAAGLGTSLYIAAATLQMHAAGIAGGSTAAGLAVFLWYGLGMIYQPMSKGSEEQKPQEKTELKDKIDHALTEARMVLPGAQALLGFQFLAMLTESFSRLPSSSKYVHLVSLGFTSLTAILLITPAAFHRIVEKGEMTPRQYRLTSRFVLAAMGTLAPAITGDLFVVIRMVSDSARASIVVSAVTLLVFYGFWFALPLIQRNKA